jgi:hypothetical protein
LALQDKLSVNTTRVVVSSSKLKSAAIFVCYSPEHVLQCVAEAIKSKVRESAEAARKCAVGRDKLITIIRRAQASPAGLVEKMLNTLAWVFGSLDGVVVLWLSLCSAYAMIVRPNKKSPGTKAGA